MKIVCDCGNEMNFAIADINDKTEEGSVYANQNRKDIEIIAEHDECWITCKKCNQSIYFFT